MIIDLPRFIEAERPSWTELETMLVRLGGEPDAALSLDEAKRFQGIAVAYAITDDFATAVINARLDGEKLPERLTLKGRAAEAALALAGIRHIERTVLRPGTIELTVRNDGPDAVRIAQVIVNDAYVALRAALAGAGIAYLPRNMTAPYLADGRLLPVLAAWCVAVSGVYIYYPSRRQMPATLQAFINFARQADFPRT